MVPRPRRAPARYNSGVGFLSSREAHLAIALAIGLLIGVERERRKEQGGGFAGLRTFGLAALLGGILGYIGSLPFVIAGAVIMAAFAVAGYATSRDEDRGTTTELALVVTYVLGVLVIEHPFVASALAVVITWILALRSELHRIVRDKLSERELRDALMFLLIAVVILPLSPDRAMGPYGAVNPQSLVRLVVVLMGLTSAGYLAQRLINPKLGLAITGLAAGFVSSSAAIAAMSVRAKEQPSTWKGAAAGGLASSFATIVQFVIVIAAVDTGLLGAIAWCLVFGGVTALVISGVFAWLSFKDGGAPKGDERPFNLWMAFGFAGIFVLVTLASSALKARFGSAGIVLVSAAAALADAHSTAGSVASLHHSQGIDDATARFAILVSLTANTLTKVILAWSGRNVPYGVTVSLGVTAIAGAAWAGVLFQ
jgi:uncharacterized membrane protein (DUF4010 family)